MTFEVYLDTVGLDVPELHSMCDDHGKHSIVEAIRTNKAKCLRFSQLLIFNNHPKFTISQWHDIDTQWSEYASSQDDVGFFFGAQQKYLSVQEDNYQKRAKAKKASFKKFKKQFETEAASFNTDLI